MSETEIALARAYLSAADQDPVGALIRSVRDLARLRVAFTPETAPPECGPTSDDRPDAFTSGAARIAQG